MKIDLQNLLNTETAKQVKAAPKASKWTSHLNMRLPNRLVFAVITLCGITATVSAFLLYGFNTPSSNHPQTPTGVSQIISYNTPAHYTPNQPQTLALAPSSQISNNSLPEVLGVSTGNNYSLQGQVLGTQTNADAAYLNTLMNNKLDNYTKFLASFGIGKNQPTVINNYSTTTQIQNGGTTIISGGGNGTYYPPVPQNNFTGSTVSSFDQLSANNLSTDNSNVSGNLNVTGSANFAGSTSLGTTTIAGALNVSGPATFATTSISNLTVNGVAITGSGGGGTSSSWTLLNNNIYNSNIGNVGIGTSTPTSELTVTDNNPRTELVTNGTFTGSASGWTLGSGWSYSSNHVSHTPSNSANLSQNIGLVSGNTYSVSFDVSGTTQGEVCLENGGQTIMDISGSAANGHQTTNFLAIGPDITFDPTCQGDNPSGDFNGTIDNVSVYVLSAVLTITSGSGSSASNALQVDNNGNVIVGNSAGVGDILTQFGGSAQNIPFAVAQQTTGQSGGAAQFVLFASTTVPSSGLYAGTESGVGVTNTGVDMSQSSIVGAENFVEGESKVNNALGIENEVLANGASSQVSGEYTEVETGGDTPLLQGGAFSVGSASSANVGTAQALYVGSQVNDSSNITNNYGLYVDSPAMNGGTIQNNYGVYINNQSGIGQTQSYNLYSSGSGLNYFGGNVGIGTTTPGSALTVNGDINLTGNLLQNGVPFSGSSQWVTGSSSNIFYNAGSVGIGTGTPGATLDVEGQALTGTGTISDDGDGDVTGIGTQFTTQLVVGDSIFEDPGLSHQAATIISITDDTHMTVGRTNNPLSGVTFEYEAPVINVGAVTGFGNISLFAINPFTASAQLGIGNQVTGQLSYAIGGLNSVTSPPTEGIGGIAIGTLNSISGDLSTAIGTENSVPGFESTAIGNDLKANNSGGMVLGSGFDSSNLLTNNIDNSLMVGFNSDQPTLFVGPSNGLGTTGSVGIGTTSPQANLDVEGQQINGPGTVSDDGSGNITGSGTSFTTDLAVGDTFLEDPGGGNMLYGLVEAIADNTHMTVGHNPSSPVSSLTYAYAPPGISAGLTGPNWFGSDGSEFNVYPLSGNVTLGPFNTVTGSNSVAIGNSNIITSPFDDGLGGMALGTENLITGNGSTAIGVQNTVSGMQSTAIGNFLNASSTNGIVLGNGVDSNNLLSNSIDNSLMVGFNSNLPTLFVGSANGTSTTGNVGIGTSTLQGKLSVVADNTTVTRGPWVSETPASNDNWDSVTFGNGLFAAVSGGFDNDHVMTSPDGITWTNHPAAIINHSWDSITFGDNTFVAVDFNNNGNDAEYSPDGSTWNLATTSPAGNWNSVAFGNSTFVAVGPAKVMTSSDDGVTWISRTAASNDYWIALTYGNGQFVAIAQNGSVMTSPDGITWTSQSSIGNNAWNSITYGNGLFVAVSNDGSGDVATSPDGITWTHETGTAHGWLSVTYGNGTFVAVSSDGSVMSSQDAVTWVSDSASEAGNWNSVAYGNGTFVTVALDSDLMISVDNVTEHTALSVSGNTIISGKIGINTTTPAYALDVNGTINASQYLLNGVPFSAGGWTNSGSDIYYAGGGVTVGSSTPVNALFGVQGQDPQFGSGTISDDGNGNITGSSTAFTTELKVGDSIVFNSVQSGIVTAISNNTHMTITENGEGPVSGQVFEYSAPATEVQGTLFFFGSSNLLNISTLLGSASLGDNQVGGIFSNAVGSDNTVTGFLSTAIGVENTITSPPSIGGGGYAFGAGNNVYSDNGLAIGNNNIVGGTGGLAFGNNLIASSTNGIVIGSGYSNTVGQYLSNTIDNSLVVGFNSNAPTLFVGPGNSTTTAGNVGIGTTTPNATLAIIAQAGINPFIIASTTGATTTYLSVTSSGNVGVGTSTPKSRFVVAANCSTFNSSSSCTDYAEIYPAAQAVAPGDVVSVQVPAITSTSTIALVEKSNGAYDGHLLGVVSTNPAIIVEGNSVQFMNGSSYENDPMNPAIALAGRVPVNVTNENGAIHAGDFLTSSADFPGYAMKASYSGEVIGQALSDFDPGTTATTATSTVLIFVKPGYQIVNNTFVLTDNNQLADATSTQGIAQAGNGFVIDQKGSGNILQLQNNEQDRFLIATTGSVSILANVTSGTSSLLSVVNASTTLFAISSVGDVTTTGHILVGQDTAGTATVNAGDNTASITFSIPYQSIPKILVTPEDVPVTFAVTNKTVNGFSIVLGSPAPQNVNLDWFVVQQPQPVLSVSSQSVVQTVAPAVVQSADNTPTPTPTPEVMGDSTTTPSASTVTPTPTDTPSPTPTDVPSPSPTIVPTPTPTPTIAPTIVPTPTYIPTPAPTDTPQPDPSP